MKISLFLLISSIIISNCLYSQKHKNPIDYRFKNGQDAYVSFFSSNITFPVKSVENGMTGNSITRISVNPKGEINGINIINPIDTLIDNEVLRVIDLSKKFWKKCDTVGHDHVFYIQIAFSLSEYIPNLCKPKAREIMKLFPEPIIVTLPKPILATLSKEDNYKKPFIKSDELSGKANSYLDNGKLEEALPLINELIKRDPFNRDLYKVRIMIKLKLNRPESVDSDDNKIFNFAEGFSLDEINRNQD